MKLSVKLLTFIVILVVCTTSFATEEVTVDLATKYQIIEGFGASDAWSCDYVGEFWSRAEKEKIANLLFSKKITPNGKPEGIGLSRWRFNIGAGSAAQNEEQSKISDRLKERRTECFLNSDGSYNWKRQAGQIYFLKQAKAYGVEKTTAFVNSPPIYMTKNGRANSDNVNRNGKTNLRSDKYHDYAKFLGNVLQKFASVKLGFDYISPVNEPQYEWNSKQEGSPWKNSEIAKIVRILDKEISDKKLKAKIAVTEAASYRYLYQEKDDPQKSRQIDAFFNKKSVNYLGNLRNILPGICAHSYWISKNDEMLRNVRTKVAKKANEHGLKLYQTEYSCMELPDGMNKETASEMDIALHHAKVIYADLAIANAVSWSWWTAIDSLRFGHKNRFLLIKLFPEQSIENGGKAFPSKSLWALGSYSRFIRPGYQRVQTLGADNLKGLMGSSYLSPDGKRLVTVFVNIGKETKSIKLSLGSSTKKIFKQDLYITDKSRAMIRLSQDANDELVIPPKSIVTIVNELN